jgi:hypothetical protein
MPLSFIFREKDYSGNADNADCFDRADKTKLTRREINSGLDYPTTT